MREIEVTGLVPERLATGAVNELLVQVADNGTSGYREVPTVGKSSSQEVVIWGS